METIVRYNTPEVLVNIDCLDIFGIKDRENTYTKTINEKFLLGVEFGRMYNNVIKKDKALQLVKNIICDKEKDIIEVYISKQTLKISEVKDIMEDQIYEYDKNYNGWLVFVDPNILSNWSHKCEYYFVVSENNIIQNSECFWMPSETIPLERVDM